MVTAGSAFSHPFLTVGPTIALVSFSKNKKGKPHCENLWTLESMDSPFAGIETQRQTRSTHALSGNSIQLFELIKYDPHYHHTAG
jgi:hypothetical protein